MVKRPCDRRTDWRCFGKNFEHEDDDHDLCPHRWIYGSLAGPCCIFSHSRSLCWSSLAMTQNSCNLTVALRPLSSRSRATCVSADISRSWQFFKAAPCSIACQLPMFFCFLHLLASFAKTKNRNAKWHAHPSCTFVCLTLLLDFSLGRAMGQSGLQDVVSRLLFGKQRVLEFFSSRAFEQQEENKVRLHAIAIVAQIRSPVFWSKPKLQFRPTPNTFTLWHECDSDEKTELPLPDENCFNCPFLHLGPSEAVPKQLAHLCLSAKLRHDKVTWCYNQNAALPQYYAL